MQLIEEFRTPLAEDQCRQAIFTFEGDNYSALRPAEYTTAQLAHLQDHLLILSGMYGILRPLDLMPPYRLEMGAALQTEKGKNLYEFWGDRITETINALCREKAYRTVVNLASAEYSRSVRQKKLQPDFLTITFKEAKGDGYKSVPIHSKRARGMMIDYVAANLLTEPDQLRSFTTGGYCFNESISNDKEWVFTRA